MGTKNNDDGMFDFSSLSALFFGDKIKDVMSFLSSSFEKEKDEFEKRGWEKLGEGYYLAPIEMENNRDNYSHLYKGEEKVSDLVLRKGGMGGKWKGDYIQLIVYEKTTRPKPKNPKEIEEAFDFGKHCIIDRKGNVVFNAEGISRYPSLYGGCLLGIDSTIRNLKTNTVIVKYDGSTLSSDKFLFVQNRFNKEFVKGVYKIEFETGEYEVFPLTK